MRILSFLLFAAVSAVWGQTDQELAKADPNGWFSYSGSFHAQRHMTTKQIHAGNVDSLAVKWIYHVPRAEELEGVPVVANGVMYVSQPNEVEALDARTGRLIWQYQYPGQARGHNRGVAVYDRKVYLGTTDAHLVALDARTGGVIWQTKFPGDNPTYQGGAPLIVKNKVIIGGYGRVGTINAFDAQTGKVAWQWTALPKAGEVGSETWGGGDPWKAGGGPVWLTGSYDPQLNQLYWGTGQPNPDFIGDRREGDNLYTDCVVSLDPDTGKLKWFFQFTPHDVHDWDAVEIPVLVDTVYQGQPRKLLVQANRNGYYYVLDRTNGKFLHGVPFVKSINWATGLSVEGRPIRTPDKDPSVQGTKVCPPTHGATNWPSPAYNPDTKMFYFLATEGCGINYRGTGNAAAVTSGSGTSYAESLDEQERWQNYVRALDVTTGKITWDYKQIGSNHYGPGVLSTGGGLVFAGDNQGMFTAHDAKSGKPLWHFNTGEKITASPMGYTVGENQFIGLLSGPNVVVFGLPDRK